MSIVWAFDLQKVISKAELLFFQKRTTSKVWGFDLKKAANDVWDFNQEGSTA
jgi:hypothetical protein